MDGLDLDPVVAEMLDLIKALREKKKMTRQQLAKAAHVHQTTIGLLERHKRNPTIQVARQITEALGVSLSSLLKQAETIVAGRTVAGKLK